MRIYKGIVLRGNSNAAGGTSVIKKVDHDFVHMWCDHVILWDDVTLKHVEMASRAPLLSLNILYNAALRRLACVFDSIAGDDLQHKAWDIDILYCTVYETFDIHCSN